MDLNLDKRHVLVTGGSRGIGKAIKKVLGEEGADVYQYCKSNGVNLMEEEGLEFAYKYMSKFNVLINNVGGCGTCSSQDWKIAMEKNYGITNRLTMEFLRKKRTFGRVITIASIYGKEKGPNPWFTAAKAAQIALMKSLAGTYPGITFNTICPGYIETGKKAPGILKNVGMPSDVANIVAFLCSRKANHINGATISVDGGESHSW